MMVGTLSSVEWYFKFWCYITGGGTSCNVGWYLKLREVVPCALLGGTFYVLGGGLNLMVHGTLS